MVVKYKWFGWLMTASLAINAQEQSLPQPAMPDNMMKPSTTDLKPAQINLSNEDLLKRTDVLLLFLNQAIDDNRWDMVEQLLPLYEKTPSPDSTMVLFAQAGLSRYRGQHSQAIASYRAIISNQPSLTPVRMTLAITLFENHQDEAAAFQFEKVRADNPPIAVLNSVEEYLAEIRRRGSWRFDGGLNYIADNNINNASTDEYVRLGDVVFKRDPSSLPQKGQGIAYFANVARDFALKGNHAVTSSASVNGKNYWNNHDYNDVKARLNLGYKWQDARVSVAATPFYQMRYFANDPYSKGYGLRLDGSYIVNPHWQVFAATELTQTDYTKQYFLDGHSLFASIGASYAPNAQTVWFAGVDAMKEVTRDASESSVRLSTRLGVVQDLPLNLSVRAQASIGRRLFEDAPSFFGVRRDDSERTYSLTLWHRQFYLWGVMPKLTWEREQVKSNINVASYRKNRVFLTLDKRF
jgi:hypothetical protein